jgi:hypothetical protein
MYNSEKDYVKSSDYDQVQARINRERVGDLTLIGITENSRRFKKSGHAWGYWIICKVFSIDRYETVYETFLDGEKCYV